MDGLGLQEGLDNLIGYPMLWRVLLNSAVIALIAGLGSTGPIWPEDILILTGLFIALWLLSARLFRKAAREQLTAGAEPEG